MGLFDKEEEQEVQNSEKINQDQVYDLITGEELSWQELIYDLIRTEQLDPWDIDLSLLADKYLEKIRKIEEENFFVSSKVLLACALLLRLKAELLVNKYIQDLNEILYGKKEEKKYELQRIELDENELPILVPKTPLARSRKISLQELMSALNNAIETENRRIRKEIKQRQAEKSALVVLPNVNRINLKDRIRDIYIKIRSNINEVNVKMSFSELAPTKDEKLAAFLPILHLSNQDKLYLDQLAHFEEIYMYLEKLQQSENKEELDVSKEFEEIWPEDKIINEEQVSEIVSEMENLAEKQEKKVIVEDQKAKELINEINEAVEEIKKD
jgi:segregation and condensation protein A